MITRKNSTTRLMRVFKVGTALGVAILATPALEAQLYNLAQPSGVTTPSGQTQAASFPQPLGVTQTPAPAIMYPPSLPVGIPAELRPISTQGVKEFLKQAARANETEIALTDMAQTRAVNPEVRQLAESLRADEARNAVRLQSLAQEYGVHLGTSPGWMNQRKIDRLQRAGPADFDREYTKILLEDRVQYINRFETAAEQLTEPDVQTYAVISLPPFRQQVRRSEYAARSVGVDEATIAAILNALPSEDQGIALNEVSQENHFTSR